MIPSGTRTRLAAYAWWVYLAVQGSAVALLIILPRDAAWVAIEFASTALVLVAVVAGPWLHRPRPRVPFVLIALGVGIYGTANAFWFPSWAGLIDPLPFPGPVDYAYIGGYVLIVAGIAAIGLVRRGLAHLGDITDAMVLALGFAAVLWEPAIEPYLLPEAHLDESALIVAASYSLADIALLGIGAWVFLGGALRSPAAIFGGIYVICQLAADVVYGTSLYEGTFSLASPATDLWAMSFLALGAAALHPSIVGLTRRTEESAAYGRRRVAVLGLSAVVGPVVTFLDASSPNPSTPALALLSVAIVVLVVIRVFLLSVDIETYRWLTTNLDNARTAYQRLVERAPAVTWTLPRGSGAQAGPDGFFMSPQVEALTGYPAADLMTGRIHWVRDVIHADDRAEAVQRYERLVEAAEAGAPGTGDQFSYEYRIVTRDGRVRWIRDDEQVVRDSDGHVTATHGIAIDITERRETEERLEASERRYRTLVEQMPSMTWVARVPPGDGEPVRTYLGPQVRELTGHPATDFDSGRVQWRDVVHPDDLGSFLERLRSGVADAVAGEPGTRDSFESEYRILAADGRVAWVHDHVRALRDATGAVVAIQGVLDDRTAQHDASAALQQLNAELETRVAERTADLDAAREVAVRASRAKSEFLSSISHELRTPLNAVLGFGQLLQVADLAPPDRESADEIVRAGRSLLAMIDEVLEFNRLDAGRISLSIEPVELGPLVREAVDLIRPAAEVRRIVLDVAAGAESTIVALTDRRRLGQVLLNLLSNAVKYNREGGSIVVRSAADGGRARIEVTDTGVGLDAIRLARVFEPFQAPVPEDSGRRSVGLGLALSHRLAALMGGTLSAVSSPGVGSTFTIDLALAAPDALDVPGPDLPAGPAAESRAGGAARARTLLYIEDNLSNIHLVERMLQKRPGIRILAAMQGRLGLELAREHQPDLILLDVHLPDVEPEETLADLKADERTRGIPVVVLSSEVSPDNASRMLELGAVAYLTKPLDLARFHAVVDEVLGR